jgi:4a-hydroxytetrahydrobiopterin dehydratase
MAEEREEAVLAASTCVPCRGGVPPLDKESVDRLHQEVGPDWRVVAGRRLEREYRFPNFRKAMAFANQVAGIAEEQKHHPDLAVGWGYVRIVLTTHAIDGLHRNDFILAARINALNVPG